MINLDSELNELNIERKLNEIRYKQEKQFLMRYVILIIIFISSSNLTYIALTSPEKLLKPIFFIIVILFFISLMGLKFMDNKSIDKRIFENIRVKMCFYLFYSTIYPTNVKKSKKYLKKAIDELDSILYHNLTYTEEMYSTFYELRDLLIYYLYPKLGEENYIFKNKVYTELRNLSLDFYNNNSIKSFDERVSNLKECIKRDETSKFTRENIIIRILKPAVDKLVFIFVYPINLVFQIIEIFLLVMNWNFEKYKISLTYRFVFYLLFTVFIDFLLISKNIVNNDVVLSATILIPIMAPYYLAPK